ncbi:MAG: hypothetical protein ACLSGS_07055 [Adlercreutzia sp.]
MFDVSFSVNAARCSASWAERRWENRDHAQPGFIRPDEGTVSTTA